MHLSFKHRTSTQYCFYRALFLLVIWKFLEYGKCPIFGRISNCSRTSTKHEEKKVKVSAFRKGLGLRHFHGVTSPYVKIYPYSKHFYMTIKKTPCRNHFYPNTQEKMPHPLPRSSRITRLCSTLNFVDIRGQYGIGWPWLRYV